MAAGSVPFLDALDSLGELFCNLSRQLDGKLLTPMEALQNNLKEADAGGCVCECGGLQSRVVICSLLPPTSRLGNRKSKRGERTKQAIGSLSLLSEQTFGT